MMKKLRQFFRRDVLDRPHNLFLPLSTLPVTSLLDDLARKD
jgi:hypothetical protein